MCSYQSTLGTRLTILSFIARYADNVISSWYETVGAYLSLTDQTDEAFGMPLPTTMFILLHSYNIDRHSENTIDMNELTSF